MTLNLRREVSNALVTQGFRRKERAHSLRVDEQFSLWVDTGPLSRRPDIAPFVGIRHERIEGLRAELMGVPANPWTGTVGANVGYVLGGEYKWWEPPAQAAEVVQTIAHALERMRTYTTLERLAEAWEIKGTRAPGWHDALITTLLVAGRFDDASDQLEVARVDLCKHDDEVCEQFRGFESRVREFIAAES